MIRRGGILSRVLALAILFSPLALGAAAFTSWAYEAWDKAGDRIHTAERAERELSAQKVQAQAYSELLPRWREFADSAGSGLGPPSTDETAQEDIIVRVRRAVDAAGGRLLSAGGLGASTTEGLRRARVEATASISASALDAMLQELETTTPYLFVDYLSLRQSEEPAAADDEPQLLALRLRVSGYRLAEARP